MKEQELANKIGEVLIEDNQRGHYCSLREGEYLTNDAGIVFTLNGESYIITVKQI